MRGVLFLILFSGYAFAQSCVLILTQNVEVARDYALKFKEANLRTKIVKRMPQGMDLQDEQTAVKLVKMSRCDYSLYMPLNMRSTNRSGKAYFEGSINLYKSDYGKFNTVTWSQELNTPIIDTGRTDALDRVKKRFINITSTKAIEYFTRS